MGPKKGAASNSKKKGTENKKKEPRRSNNNSNNSSNNTSNTNNSNRQDKGNNGDSRVDLSSQIDLSVSIPLPLQQLLLNIFKSALLPTSTARYQTPVAGSTQEQHQPEEKEKEAEEEEKEILDTKSLIQTIKSHLYNRDFASAFTDAGEDLLRVYALRWSATRALGYAGILKAVLRGLVLKDYFKKQTVSGLHGDGMMRIVCIGGGAGAEIVAVAGVWRELVDEMGLEEGIAGVQLNDNRGDSALEGEKEMGVNVDNSSRNSIPSLSVTAVDIADWSSVVERLSAGIRSPTVRSSESHPAPLLQLPSDHPDGRGRSPEFRVDFNRSDVLALSDDEMHHLFHKSKDTDTSTVLVTLLFTLNELFSTSMAKATGFLLCMTDSLAPGTVLLVVDSPGSYSTLTLGKGKEGEAEAEDSKSQSPPKERQYPMKFLLDHTLLSVAEGKWERIYSQDSRWWRRDASRLRYTVGEAAGLEDMRFQVHVYRRLGSR